MQSAAQTRHVPIAIIEATAYVNTRWEWIPTPALDGGIGPMNIRPSQMAEAQSLSGHPAAAITGDLAANLDAGAALLSHYHASGTDLSTWQAAVDRVEGPYVAQQIFEVLHTGASRTTSTGETITLAPQAVAPTGTSGGAASVDTGSGTTTTTCAASSPDYGAPACWAPADPSNYSVADRGHDYPIDMIVIHDIEGSYGSAIQMFQTPNFAASAHYVVSYGGAVTQMVREKDIAWHAGNWDYNTRSIGIEHEGFAWTPGLYTTAEYNASAQIAASICSRWGVPLDRNHVIGHNEVPDPNNPSLFGGSDHHTDPGPYWNWTYYMQQAQADAKSLPSPPHLTPDPVASSSSQAGTAIVRWTPAHVCRAADAPITGYTVVAQPGGMTQTLPATATSATFSGLQQDGSYAFTVTATNSYGQDSATSNTVIVGACSSVSVTTTPASPQLSGTTVQVTANATGCPDPTFHFGLMAPGSSSYQTVQDYSTSATYAWNTLNAAPGVYRFSVWAKDASSPGVQGNTAGRWDAYDNNTTYSLGVAPCTSVSVSTTPGSSSIGTAVTITAKASGCPKPLYHFGVAPSGGAYQLLQDYSSNASATWNTSGLAPGTYRFSIWARDTSSSGTQGNWAGRWDTYNNFVTYTLTTCSSLAVTSAPASQANVGSTITITATATGCANPLYHFGVMGPGATAYTTVQDYSTSPTLAWNTSGLMPGTYRFSVWARDANSTGTQGNWAGRWDTYNNFFTYTLTTCSSLPVTAAPASPANVGSTVTLTAKAAGCANPLYHFGVMGPGATTYTTVQDYSSSATFTWNTSGLMPGTYRFSVWARDANSPGAQGNWAGRWDTYNNTVTYTLSTCTAVAVSVSPPSPSKAGTTVTVTARATGCASPVYHFGVMAPGSTSYVLAQDYSSSGTYTWNTTGLATGTYRFSVWVRDANSSGSQGNWAGRWDAYNNYTTYQLN